MCFGLLSCCAMTDGASVVRRSGLWLWLWLWPLMRAQPFGASVREAEWETVHGRRH